MISENAGRFPVRWMCRQLKVSCSGYYAWKCRDDAARRVEERHLRLKIRGFHAASRGTYGSPRIHRDLICSGLNVGRNRVARLMREEGLWGRQPQRLKKTTNAKHGASISRDLVNRKFKADAPNRLWVSDISYIRTWEGWVYLAVLLDVFSRRVVGYALADHMRAELVVQAFDRAAKERKPEPGLIHHSDRGSQYTSKAFKKALRSVGARSSMGSKGDCFDNSMAESFFATLKEELIYRGTWPTKRRAIAAVIDYIENFYNVRRRHSALGNISPLEYEIGLMSIRRAA